MQPTPMFARPAGKTDDNDAIPGARAEPPEAVNETVAPAPTPAGQPAPAGFRSSVHASSRGEAPKKTLVDRIKEAMPLLTYVQSLTTMKENQSRNGEWFGSCISPAHDDQHASFYVNEKKGLCQCKSCGISGNVIQMFALVNGLDDEEAKFQLGRDLNVMNDRRLNDVESMLKQSEARYVWQLVRNETAMKYLASRGLSPETIEKWGLGYCYGTEMAKFTPEQLDLAVKAGVTVRPNDPSLPMKSFLRGRITFSVRDRAGVVVGFAGRVVPAEFGGFASNGPKYMNSPETELFHKSELLYGAYHAQAGISKSGYATVVEGYMDVIGLDQAGVHNAVAVMGASANASTFANLWGMTKRVVFCLDGDAAGINGAMQSVMAAAPTMPDGCEIAVCQLPAGMDPDEFVLKYGADAFRSLCDAATPLSRLLMEQRAANHDLSYPEGRARFMVDAREVAAKFVLAPQVGEEIVAEAKAIKAAALVAEALRLTGVAEDVGENELKAAIALMNRRLSNLQSSSAARAHVSAEALSTAPAGARQAPQNKVAGNPPAPAAPQSSPAAAPVSPQSAPVAAPAPVAPSDRVIPPIRQIAPRINKPR